MERSTYYKIAIVLGAAALATGAFSKETRKKIWKRDGSKSKWSGETQELTVAHVNHNKKLPIYDSEENGRLLTWKEQYIDHFNRHGTEDLGLNESQNKWALATIWRRLTQKEDLPPPEEAGKTIIPILMKRK